MGLKKLLKNPAIKGLGKLILPMAAAAVANEIQKQAVKATDGKKGNSILGGKKPGGADGA